MCQCTRYPRAGGVGDQDAWLWQSLSLVRDVTNQILSEQSSKT
jgi:hypothetical protein